jgi:hypothetical protein
VKVAEPFERITGLSWPVVWAKADVLRIRNKLSSRSRSFIGFSLAVIWVVKGRGENTAKAGGLQMKTGRVETMDLYVIYYFL